MSLISITFAGQLLKAYQKSETNYIITASELQLYNGDIFGTASPKKRNFPRAFDCYTDDYTSITMIANLIGVYGTLVIDGESFTDCYISGLGSIKELWQGTGKYTFNIKFSKVDQH